MTRVRRPLVGLLIGVLGLLCGTGVVAAQTAQVVHNVNLRADPSPNNSPIRLVMPPEDLSLISTIKQNGYFHVRTAMAEDGWVWSLNVEVITTPPAPPPPPPLPLGIATSLSSSWEKAAPNHSQYTNGNGEVCGAFGTPGSDANTNVRKNRKDIHGAYHPVAVDALANAPYPAGAPTKRSGWTAAQLAIIEPFEGEAVSVIGYLATVKNEGKEKTNCSFSKAVDVDWHLALVEHEDDDEPDAIVVEVTPRVRRNHDTWTLARLRDHNIEVRISGWTMLDPDHPGHIGTYRSTLWEIHPITKLEIRQNGAWVDLDNQ